MPLFKPSAHYETSSNTVEVEYFPLIGGVYKISVPEDLIVGLGKWNTWGYQQCVDFVLHHDAYFEKEANKIIGNGQWGGELIKRKEGGISVARLLPGSNGR